jgi:cofilin
VKAFEELKLGKKSKYIIFTLNDKKSEIIVEKVSLGGDYDDFVEDLPATECRWGVFDLEYKKDGEGEGKRNKLIFVSWYVLTIFYFLFFNNLFLYISIACMRTWACDCLRS